jgi:hypothetical protein
MLLRSKLCVSCVPLPAPLHVWKLPTHLHILSVFVSCVSVAQLAPLLSTAPVHVALVHVAAVQTFVRNSMHVHHCVH